MVDNTPAGVGASGAAARDACGHAIWWRKKVITTSIFYDVTDRSSPG